MSSKLKHKQRSHRSYRNNKPFNDFNRRSSVSSYNKAQRNHAKGIKAMLDKFKNLKSSNAKKDIKEDK